MENKNLIIVTSKGGEKYGNYLFQLISDYDGVDAALWSENEYKDNRVQLSSSQYVVFVGDSKAEKSIIGISYKYDDGVVKIGWKGTRAVITSTSGMGFGGTIKEIYRPSLKKMLFPIPGMIKDVADKFSASKTDNYMLALDMFVEEYMPEFLKFEPAQEKDVTEQSSSSAADEIFKFKQLLDAGIITEEEFEAKKKQLLNL